MCLLAMIQKTRVKVLPPRTRSIRKRYIYQFTFGMVNEARVQNRVNAAKKRNTRTPSSKSLDEKSFALIKTVLTSSSVCKWFFGRKGNEHE